MRPKRTLLPRLLILAGLLLIAAVVLLVKEKPKAAAPVSRLPEAQLARALQEQQPVLAFFHSDNCKSCIEMMGIVEQVYPEFSDSVVLVDVNVYAGENKRMLQGQKIQYIPTLIFYDPQGTRKVSVGVMEAGSLRQTLETISEGKVR